MTCQHSEVVKERPIPADDEDEGGDYYQETTCCSCGAIRTEYCNFRGVVIVDYGWQEIDYEYERER
jgi:hypothetical protein